MGVNVGLNQPFRNKTKQQNCQNELKEIERRKMKEGIPWWLRGKEFACQ